ncbi:MAG: CoA transferase [Ilumatobacteraceae bacterium]
MTSSGSADTADDTGDAKAAGSRAGPLAGLRVLDASTVLAGPNAARYLGDFGADVIKVERPGGDSLRNMAWKDHRDGIGLWWKLVNRNKRTIVLDLRDDADRDVFCDLAAEADVLIENSRPGALERLGVGPEVLHARNPGLVIVRVTGFGQDGPYASRAGFASIAEGVSGLAALSGEPDGPPTLPAIALTDEVTGLAAAFATMVALRSGKGQVVDVNLLESVVQLLGPLPSVYAVNGEQQPRLGSGLPYTVPRGVYQCSDGLWVVVSTSSDTVAARVMRLLGLDHRPEFATFDGRGAHRVELDGVVAAYCSQRTRVEVIAEFTAAEAAIGPIYDQADLAVDEHVVARDVITDLDGVPQQNLIARLSATPGALRWNGRPLDADGGDIRRHGWSPGNQASPGHV